MDTQAARKRDWMQELLLPGVIALSYFVLIPIATYATYRGFYYLDGDAIRLSIGSIAIICGLTVGILSYRYSGD